MKQAELRAPRLRVGVQYRSLAGGRVFVYHPRAASQILETRVFAALRLCQSQSIEEMLPEVRAVLDYDCTAEEWVKYLNYMAGSGLFEDTPNQTPLQRLFDPGSVIEFLTKKCRWIFSTPTVVGLFVLLGVGLWRLLSNWGLFLADVRQAAAIHPLLSVFLFYFCFLPVGLLHELAHGVVCCWFQGEVLEVGMNKKSANLYVITDKTPLTASRARIMYLAGGAFLDMLVFFLLVNLWLAFPHYLTLIFLLPQAMFVLVFSYAMEGGSDLSKIITEWTGIAESEGRLSFLKEFLKARPKTRAEWKRAAVYLGSIALQTAVVGWLIWSFRKQVPVAYWPGDVLHIPFWPPLLYLFYRLLRRASLKVDISRLFATPKRSTA